MLTSSQLFAAVIGSSALTAIVQWWARRGTDKADAASKLVSSSGDIVEMLERQHAAAVARLDEVENRAEVWHTELVQTRVELGISKAGLELCKERISRLEDQVRRLGGQPVNGSHPDAD